MNSQINVKNAGILGKLNLPSSHMDNAKIKDNWQNLKDINLHFFNMIDIPILIGTGMPTFQPSKFASALDNCQGFCQGKSVFSLMCVSKNYCQGEIVLTTFMLVFR